MRVIKYSSAHVLQNVVILQQQAEQVTGEKVSILTYTLLCCMNICISTKRSKTNYFATFRSYVDFMALKKNNFNSHG